MNRQSFRAACSLIILLCSLAFNASANVVYTYQQTISDSDGGASVPAGKQLQISIHHVEAKRPEYKQRDFNSMVDGKPWTPVRAAEYEGGHGRAFWGARTVITYGVNRVCQYELAPTDLVYIYRLFEAPNLNGTKVYDLVQHLKKMLEDYNRNPRVFGDLFEGGYDASFEWVVEEYLNTLHQGQMVWLPMALSDESNSPLIPVVPLGHASVTVDDDGSFSISWAVAAEVAENPAIFTPFSASTQITLTFSATGDLREVSGISDGGLTIKLLLSALEVFQESEGTDETEEDESDKAENSKNSMAGDEL